MCEGVAAWNGHVRSGNVAVLHDELPKELAAEAGILLPCSPLCRNWLFLAVSISGTIVALLAT